MHYGFDAKENKYVEKVFMIHFDFSNPRQGYSDGILQDRFNKINLGLRYSAEKINIFIGMKPMGILEKTFKLHSLIDR